MMHQLMVAGYSAAVLILTAMVMRLLEQRWPAVDVASSEVYQDWRVTAANVGVGWLIGPVTATCSAAIVQALGGGLIHLRTDGYWYLSLAGYVLIADLYRYAFHRLQHAVPALWAMHSLHHSAEAVTFVTGGRHYWFERIVSSVFLPVLPVLFDMPEEMVPIVATIFVLPDSFSHLNVRFPMGRFITWINSPQWHRIHHSVEPQHWNKNFSGGLLLWDFLFGTAYIPKPGEYPATGLSPSEDVSVVSSVVWPVRHLLRRVA